MFMESLSKYLPDEDHPEYQAYEDALPQFKKELEKRYPQVCKRCAPKAQQKMFEADYYGMNQHAAILAEKKYKRRGRGRSGSPRGLRDDWSKWIMRLLLALVGMVVYASLLAQTAWHTYAIFTTIFSSSVADATETTEFAFEPTWKDCAQQSLSSRFDTPCYHLFDTIIPKALATSLCLLWYNPGHKAWWHDTHKMEAVYGQREHFFIQAILLVMRALAWFKLSDSTVTTNLDTQQLLAAHGFMIAFQILCQWLSERVIKSQIWKIKGKIMPRPSEQDIFGPTAGPADEQYARQASSKPPLTLFPRNEKPFNIESLAPRPLNSRGYSRLEFAGGPPPSPPDSQSVSDDDEFNNNSNDMDWQPSVQSQMPGAPINRTFRPKYYESREPLTRSIYNYGTTQPSGWGAMRQEVFGIEDATRAADERKRREAEERAKLRYEPPVEQSPFRGRLPQMPMSMERRLRNPITQVQFKKVDPSKQQDFMKQMREGIESGKTFTNSEVEKKTVKFRRTVEDSDDEDFSPAKSRTKGSLDLAAGKLRLPRDVPQATGLEDLFAGKSFGISDEPGVELPTRARRTIRLPWGMMLVVGVLVALLAVAWNVQPIRRTVCLWLAAKLQDLGY